MILNITIPQSAKLTAPFAQRSRKQDFFNSKLFDNLEQELK